MTNKEKGDAYEKFVQQLCSDISSYQENNLELIELQNKKIIADKYGVEHEIDVYWHCRFESKEYKIIIECKSWDTNDVPIEKIAALDSYARAIGNVVPVIVTTKDFNSGAITYGNNVGVTCFIVRSPNYEDLKGRLKSLTFKTKISMRYYKKVEILPDASWMKENNVTDAFLKYPCTAFLCDSNYSEESLMSPEELFFKNIQKLPKNEDVLVIEPDNLFANNMDGTIRFKVAKIIYSGIYSSSEEESFVFNTSDLLKRVIIDAKTREKVFFDDKGKITSH